MLRHPLFFMTSDIRPDTSIARLTTAHALTRQQFDELVHEFMRDVWVDCHQIRTAYLRSECARALLRHGLPALWAVSRWIKYMRSAKATSAKCVAFMFLLQDFCAVLGYVPPYSSDTLYIDMNLRRWRKFIYEPKKRVPKMKPSIDLL